MFRDRFSESVSVPSTSVARSPTASDNEYGDEVRDIGITALGRMVPLPVESTVSTRCPSSEPVLMCAVLAEPSCTAPFTVNVTRTSPFLSDMSETLPTLMPDTVTSLPVTRPPASANTA